ncbi:MAG: exodeoxyribonuclease VII large subunit, partial [Ktedonobacterales bacterium]
TQSHRLDLASPRRRVDDARQQVDDALHALSLRMQSSFELQREHLRGAALRLHALSPLLTIGRGYAVVRREADGALVTSVAQVSPGQGLSIRVSDGALAAVAGPRLDTPPDVDTAPPGAVPRPAARRARTAPVADLRVDDATEREG